MNKKLKLNVLISAYYCDPYRGSEESVGWNFSKSMAQHHRVWVLTKQSNQKKIEAEMAIRPVADLSFIYYDFHRSRLFNEKLLGEQLSYIFWQILVVKKYKSAAKKIKFDLIHHVTFNQYRSPSIGFFVKKPFIMGPVGGAEILHPVFSQDLAFSTKLKERWRRMGPDRFLFGLLARIRRNPKIFVFSSEQNLKNLKKYIPKRNRSLSIPAIGITLSDFSSHTKKAEVSVGKPFTMIYAGTAKDWKGLSIFLTAVAETFKPSDNVTIKLIGIRNEAENKKVSDRLQQKKITDKVQLVNFMPREQLIKELCMADLSVYPAFRDSGSMSVLEGCALKCPVLCFDAGGQDAFPAEILIKIPVSGDSYQSNVDNISTKLKWAFNHPAELKDIGAKAQKYVFEHFTWDKKVELFCGLYNELLNSTASNTNDI